MSNNRILHITNNDFDGVGRAVLRLHKGLLNLGIESKVLVLHKRSKEKHVYAVGYAGTLKTLLVDFVKSSFHFDGSRVRKILRFILFKLKVKILHLKNKPTSLFNFGLSAVDFKELSVYFLCSDILFLHGMHDILSPEGVYRAYKNFSLKIFYHILDMEPITGGCHFNFECENYLRDCNNCPQINSNSIAHAILNRKKDLYGKIPISWIVPNNFVLDILNKSYVVDKLHTVNVVFMGIESQRYKNIDKSYARNKLGLPEKPTILFGCFNFSDERKGAQILKKSLDGSYMNNFELNNIHLVTFGELNGFSFEGIKPQWTHLGSIDTSEEMNMLYRASDLLASPSIDDIGPTIVQEAFMNHLPIVAFNLGVAKDLVKNNINGNLIPCFNIEKFAKSILACLLKLEKLDYKNDNELLSYEKKCSINSEAREFLKLTYN